MYLLEYIFQLTYVITHRSDVLKVNFYVYFGQILIVKKFFHKTLERKTKSVHIRKQKTNVCNLRCISTLKQHTIIIYMF